MIPNPDQLQALVKMREGDLAEIPFAVLLHAMAASEQSVVLEIERKPLKKEIVIENGIPVDCRSNLLHETLPRFMVAQGHITEEQSAEYLGRSAGQGLNFEEALILDNVISASELYKILQANLARKLLDGFTWRSGTFRVRRTLPKVESPLKVKTPQLVVTGVAKFAGGEEVNGAVGPLVGKRLFLHPAPAYDLDDIRLSDAQGKVVTLLEQGKRIDELAAETTVPFDKIMRLLYALAIMGIVVPEDWMPEEPVEPKRKAKKQKAMDDTMAVKLQQAATAPAMQLADLERLSNRVMATYLRYRSLDSFELLEVPDTAGMVEVQDAYVAYSRKFAPWQFEAPGLQILVDKAADLFIAGGQAFGELCDVEKRNALIAARKARREEEQKSSGPAADRFAIKSDLLDSELQFKRGHTLMQKGKYREALTQLQFAYDCDPQNSVYRAELAFCRFLDNPREAERSAEDLRETLRIDPKSGLATYYLGRVETEVENFEEAERLLQRAIKMLMPDRRPIEALKDLQVRAKNKKKKKLGFLGG